MKEIFDGASLIAQKVLEKADKRGHKNQTIGAGTGAMIGGSVGSFLGPIGTVVGAAVLGLGGYLIANGDDK